MYIVIIYVGYMKNKKEIRTRRLLTLKPSVVAEATKHAFVQNKSFSRHIEDLLEKENKRLAKKGNQ